MPQYYIHIEDDDGFTHDGEGFNAKDLPGAMRMMRRSAGEIIADQLQAGYHSISFSLCLDDERSKRLVTMPFSTAMGPPTG